MQVTLNKQNLQDAAPAALATQPAERVSARYKFYPTREIISALAQENWQVVDASTAGSRRKNPIPLRYRRHKVVFADKDLLRKKASMTEIPRLILTNSHDGNSAAILRAGLWRFLCSNGMEIPDSLIQSVRIPHTVETLEYVIQAAQAMREHADLIGEHVETFRARQLSNAEVIEFGRQAINLRQEADSNSVIAIEDILRLKRDSDAGNSLWKVFNRTQEWLLKGEYPIYQLAKHDWHVRTARPIRGIDQSAQLNGGLWELAEQFSLN
jgi:hypothetical protein